MDLNLGFLFLSELLGTMVLVALGTSVNAGVNSKKSYSHNSGWIVVTLGWAMAIMIGASIAAYGGAAINPAVSIAYATLDIWTWSQFAIAITAQFVGAIIGALITVALFWNYFDQKFSIKKTSNTEKKVIDNSEDSKKEKNIEKEQNKEYDTLRGIFATQSSIGWEKLTSTNWIVPFMVEVFGTFLLVAALLLPAVFGMAIGQVIPVPLYAGLVVLGIGLTLGSITGFAINPARDLGPRIVYQIIPFNDKKTANWSYGWIPLIAPFAGAEIAVGVIKIFQLAN